MTQVVGPWGWVTPGAPGVLWSGQEMLSTRNVNGGLRWITFDDIMMTVKA